MKRGSWITLVAGAWLIVAPFVLAYGRWVARAEDIVLGIFIIVFSLASAAVVPAWVVALAGAWVIVAPFVIGYSATIPQAATNDVITGAVVLVFAVIAARKYTRAIERRE